VAKESVFKTRERYCMLLLLQGTSCITTCICHPQTEIISYTSGDKINKLPCNCLHG